MPELEHCMNEFRKLFPEMPITSVYDYNKNRFLFICTKPSGRHKFGVMFLVSKDGKNADDYVPINDSDNYLRVTNKAPIYEN